MEQRRLGDGLVTSALGLGCMGFSQGYGATDDDESVATVQAALGAGIRLLDTAMSYGSGHNEQLIGRALSTAPAAAADAQVATKFGIVRGPDGVGLDAHPERVAGYCEASLSRLGVDTIELYYLHRVDPRVPIAETVAAMAQLVAAGKVRHLGLSEVTPAQLADAVAVHPIAAVQFEWSLAWREPETGIVPAARRLGVGLVPYSPLGRGLLTATLDADSAADSDFRRNDPRFGGQHLAANLAQAAALREVAAELGVEPAQLALAWLLAQGDDVVPVPGSRRARRVVGNAAAVRLRLTGAQLARLEEAVPSDRWAGDRASFAAPATKRAGYQHGES